MAGYNRLAMDAGDPRSIEAVTIVSDTEPIELSTDECDEHLMLVRRGIDHCTPACTSRPSANAVLSICLATPDPCASGGIVDVYW